MSKEGIVHGRRQQIAMGAGSYKLGYCCILAGMFFLKGSSSLVYEDNSVITAKSNTFAETVLKFCLAFD